MYRRKRSRRSSRRVKTRRHSSVKRKTKSRSFRTRRSSKRRRGGRGKIIKNSWKEQLLDASTNPILTRKSFNARAGPSKVSTSTLVKANLQHATYRWEAINPYMNGSIPARNNPSCSTGGALQLSNFKATAGGLAAAIYCPLHMFDLTSVPNIINGTYTSPKPGFELSFTCNSAGAPIEAVFSNLIGDGNGNYGTSSAWQGENWGSASASSVSQPNRRTLHKGASIKMMLYGATNTASNFKISIVKIKQDWMHPDGPISNTYAGISQEGTRVLGWEQAVKPFVSHPLAQETKSGTRPFKIIKEYDFTIQPINGTSGSSFFSKEVDIWVPINKINKYDWNERSADTNLEHPTSYAQNLASLSNELEPKKRIYLMVRALNYKVDGTLPTTCAHTPSYDIVIKNHIANIA